MRGTCQRTWQTTGGPRIRPVAVLALALLLLGSGAAGAERSALEPPWELHLHFHGAAPVQVAEIIRRQQWQESSRYAMTGAPPRR